jgi:hypothetical protein
VLSKVDGTNWNVQWVTPASSATWGAITGTLSSQTDLQSALDAKADITISATAPSSPTSGDLWLRTTDYRTFTWTGVQWVESSAGFVSAIGSTFETVSKNLSAYPSTLAYSGGNLSSITYALGGGLTIVKTFSYTGSNLTSIVLSGYTPGGISLTKTLTYSSGNLVGISYS